MKFLSKLEFYSIQIQTAFCGFSLAVTSTGPGGFMFFLCVFPKAQPKVVLEKPGIEPVTLFYKA